MPGTVQRTTLSTLGLAGLVILGLLTLQIGFQLSTRYLYLLLFAAGTIAFFMIGYQLILIMREDDAGALAAPPPTSPAPRLIMHAPLTAGDQIVLDWATERLESGSTLDAGSKLERLSADARNHPQVLRLKHQIYFAERRWHAALETAKAWAAAQPDDPAPWEAQAASLCELRQFTQAMDLLTPLAERFPGRPELAYKLSQLCAEMGRLEQAQGWLFKALDAGDKHRLVSRVMQDQALEPLIHFLGRRCMVERMLANPAEAAGREALAFAARHGIPASECDAKGSVISTIPSAAGPGQFDAIVVFADAGATDESLFPVVEQAQRQRRPYMLVREGRPEADPVAELLTFLEQHRVLSVRIAGDATGRPAMEQFVRTILESAFDYQLRSLLHGTCTPATLRF